jgi:dihydrofolate synthase/folylpolyglutamate synthase
VAHGVLRDLRSLAGIEATRWPGRLELRAGPPRVLLDAAHNVEGLQALARALDDLAPYDARVLAFGLSSGKDAAACTALVPRVAPAVVLVEGFHRARAAGDLRALLPDGVTCLGAFATPRALVEFATRDAGAELRGATLVAAGSIFMVGDVERCVDEVRAAAACADAAR